MGSYRLQKKNNIETRLAKLGFEKIGGNNYVNHERKLIIRPAKKTKTFILFEKNKELFVNNSVLEIEKFLADYL